MLIEMFIEFLYENEPPPKKPHEDEVETISR